MRCRTALAARLAAHGIRGQLYIVGGNAMIVGYGRERTTRDVAARIEYAKGDVLAAAEEIAAEADLDPNWLNENARLFMPPARDDRAHTVFNAGPGRDRLSAEHTLAMKIDAARNSETRTTSVHWSINWESRTPIRRWRSTGRCCHTRRLSTRGDGNSCGRSS